MNTIKLLDGQGSHVATIGQDSDTGKWWLVNANVNEYNDIRGFKHGFNSIEVCENTVTTITYRVKNEEVVFVDKCEFTKVSADEYQYSCSPSMPPKKQKLDIDTRGDY